MKMLQEKFEVSRATLKRDIEVMRDRLEAPVFFDRVASGYVYIENEGEGPYELPGLWFNASEVHALLLMHELLKQLQSSVLGEPLRPVEQRLKKLLEGRSGDVGRRFLLLSTQMRQVPPKFFQVVSSATVERKRLELKYFAKAKAERKLREVSPQRLIHYRSNWYLHAWCHLRNGLRSFALDSIEQVKKLDQPALEVDAAEVQAHIGKGYGIFSGEMKARAVLEFNAEAARWVRKEIWHADQQVEEMPGGGVRLTVPVTEPKELVMDVMRYGPNVVVRSPGTLRAEVMKLHLEAAQQYDGVRIGPGRARTAGPVILTGSSGEPLRSGS